MGPIGELKAQHVGTGWKRQRCFQGAGSQVYVLLVFGNNCAGRDEVGVDEEVEVPGAFPDRTGRLYRKPVSAETDGKGRRDDGLIGGLHEEDLTCGSLSRCDFRHRCFVCVATGSQETQQGEGAGKNGLLHGEWSGERMKEEDFDTGKYSFSGLTAPAGRKEL